MFLPNISPMLSQRSITNSSIMHKDSYFSLDTSGVSGFFGGDEAISAMATVHIYRGRRWLGWYNTPGSYQIAKQYGLIAKSTFFKGIFPGVRTDPAKLFEFDGSRGPKYRGVASGTIMEHTGHLATVLMGYCASVDEIKIEGRDGPGVRVTVVKLNTVPPRVVHPERVNTYSPLFAFIPIFASLAAFVASFAYHDWFSSSLILWGMLSNGISCLVIGAGRLYFTHHIPSAGCPPGDGILGSGQEFVVLQGAEGAVNSITLGKFKLEFPSEFYDDYIGYCSILLTIQFIAQLFLIPLGSLFGQIMFIFSLAVSWIYNSCLSAFDREKIQQHILLDQVLKKPSSKRYFVTTRGSALVLVLCLLAPEDPGKILETYIPNNTKVWRKWREVIAQRLRDKEELRFTAADSSLPGFTDDEKRLLQTLYADAEAAYDGFVDNSKGHL
jgi:hypothetical protein